MIHPSGEPSYRRFKYEALATADLHAARTAGYRDFDLERSVAAVVQTSHEAGRSLPVVTAEGTLALATSTVLLPLEWRGYAPDCTVIYTVKERPTRYFIRRAFFGDCGAVLASYTTISSYS